LAQAAERRQLAPEQAAVLRPQGQEEAVLAAAEQRQPVPAPQQAAAS
jgi:hypothetical protein